MSSSAFLGVGEGDILVVACGVYMYVCVVLSDLFFSAGLPPSSSPSALEITALSNVVSTCT